VQYIRQTKEPVPLHNINQQEKTKKCFPTLPQYSIIKYFASHIMKHRSISLIFLLVMLVMATSCGRTVYRKSYTSSNKYIKEKKRYHFWHAHGAKPRQHAGGYW